VTHRQERMSCITSRSYHLGFSGTRCRSGTTSISPIDPSSTYKRLFVVFLSCTIVCNPVEPSIFVDAVEFRSVFSRSEKSILVRQSWFKSKVAKRAIFKTQSVLETIRCLLCSPCACFWSHTIRSGVSARRSNMRRSCFATLIGKRFP